MTFFRNKGETVGIKNLHEKNVMKYSSKIDQKLIENLKNIKKLVKKHAFL